MARSLLGTLLFTIVVPGTVAVYIPWRMRGPGPHAVYGFAWLGVLPAAAGAAAYLWCAWDFATFGRGTPLPLDAPKRFASRGLYRFVRNPMYIGVLLVILGQALLFRSWAVVWYALLVAALFHSFVVLYEEPALRRKFGKSYETYCQCVSRWIPKRAAGCVPGA